MKQTKHIYRQQKLTSVLKQLLVALFTGVLITSFVACADDGADKADPLNDNGSGSTEGWENWQTIEIIEGTGTATGKISVSTPWNTTNPQNAFSTNIGSISSEDGWELIMNTCGNTEYGAGRNYLIFYNTILGIMRVFYYCDINITGTGNEHFWEVLLGKNDEKRAYYGQLPFTPPFDKAINKTISGGSFKTDDIFRQMVSTYRDSSGKTFIHKTWNCFDLDMSAYFSTNFRNSSDEIVLNLYAKKTEAVSLESQLEGKIEGNFDLTSKKLPVSSTKGFFGDLADVMSLGSGLIKGAFGIFSGNYGSTIDTLNTVASSLSGAIGSINGYLGKEKVVYKGNVDFHLTGTIDTQGYITENGLATDIPTFRITSGLISADSHFGEGIWNLTTTPRIIALEGLHLDPAYTEWNFGYNTITMLDPESIELVLREDIKEKATDIQLDTVWGLWYKDNVSYSDYRNALGLPETREDGESTSIWLKLPIDQPFSILDAELKDEITEQREHDSNLYGSICAKMQLENSENAFIAFPQSGQYYNSWPFATQNLLVVVRLQFKIDGKQYVFTRRYLPTLTYYQSALTEKVTALLKIRKERKLAGWLVDGVSYPVVQAELENLYSIYYNENLQDPDNCYDIDYTYKD